LASQQTIEQLVAAIVEPDSGAVIEILNQLKATGVAGRTVVDQLIKQLLPKTNEHPQLFSLIDKLISSVDAFDIYLKLLAILAAETAGAKPKPSAPQPLLAEPIAPTISESVPKPVAKPVKPKPENPVPPKPVSEASLPDRINWDEFVKAVTEINRTCGSCLINASFNYADGILTLYFKSNIFRSKMQDSKWKNVLKAAAAELYDIPPKIEISEGLKPKNATLSAVADIMGGVEVL
jgi:hypothetical protein